MKAKTICPICKKEKVTDCSSCIEGGTLVCDHDEAMGPTVMDDIKWEIFEKDPEITKKIIYVPYYSQYDESLDEHWQKRVCGLVCLKMVLDFYGSQTPDLKDFLKLALEKEAYHNPNGWIHDKLLEIAKDFGRKEAHRKEYKSQDEREQELLLENGISEIVFYLGQNKPVIVSAVKKFEFKDKFHQVVLVGLESDDMGNLLGFYYHDSDYLNEEGKNLFVSLEKFNEYWRKMAIFI